MEAMGQTRIQGTPGQGGELRPSLEHGQVGTWAMAAEPEPGAFLCPSR